jgi:hypothetical protein
VLTIIKSMRTIGVNDTGGMLTSGVVDIFWAIWDYLPGLNSLLSTYSFLLLVFSPPGEY